MTTCADLEGGLGGSDPPLEFAKLNIADITGNEKKFLLKVGPPLEKFSGSAPGLYSKLWKVYGMYLLLKII